MEPTLIASYALAVAGLGILGWTGWLLNSANINRKVGNSAVLRLLKAGNASRAQKLCQFAPHSYFTALGAAIEAALATGSRDRVTLGAAIDPAFATASNQIVVRWRTLLERGLLGAMVALAGVGLSMSEGIAPTALYVAGGLTLVALGWFALVRNGLNVSLEAARLEVLPVLITTIADGPASEPAPANTGPLRVAQEPKVVPRTDVPDPVGRNSLRGGLCPLCEHTTITRVDGNDERFYTLVCRGCGYSQLFAELAKLDT